MRVALTNIISRATVGLTDVLNRETVAQNQSEFIRLRYQPRRAANSLTKLGPNQLREVSNIEGFVTSTHAPGSAHAGRSTQPRIDMSKNLSVTLEHLPQPMRSHIRSF